MWGHPTPRQRAGRPLHSCLRKTGGGLVALCTPAFGKPVAGWLPSVLPLSRIHGRKWLPFAFLLFRELLAFEKKGFGIFNQFFYTNEKTDCFAAVDDAMVIGE